MKSQSMRYLILALFVALTTGMMAQDYSSAYATIEQLNQEGKFRSALAEAVKVYELADKAGDEDQLVKALAYRAAYTFQLEEEGFEAALRLLRAELAENENRPVVAPVLNHLVGKGYYNYAQRNLYRLRNATATSRDSVPLATAPLADWNLQQLADAADEHLLRGLELANEQRTGLAEIPAIIRGDAAKFAETPTLYDLLAREAMSLLASPLLNVGDPVPEDLTDYLVPAEAFVNLPLDAFAEGSGTRRTLRLHQQLVNYHLGPANRALLRVDMDRMDYLRRLGVDDEAYLVALRRTYERYAAVPGHGMFLVKQAGVYNRADDKLGALPRAKALELLGQVEDKDQAVVNAAEQLRREITGKSLLVSAREVYGKTDNILIQLRFRNVARVYHRLVETKEFSDNYYGYNVEAEELAKLRKQKAVAKADFRLPANDDYNEHQTETWLKTQAPGRYYLLTSTGPDFDMEQELVSINRFQISDLALVKFDDGEGDSYLKVLDRTTGAPRAGVRVTVRQRSNRRDDKWKTVENHTTAADGRIPTTKADRVQIKYLLKDGNDSFISDPEYAYRNDRRNFNRVQTVTPLFTDRSIYRPGQTVHVYGVTLEKDEESIPKLLTDESRELTLFDVNGQEVDQVEVVSDAYSRFNHSFKLPEGGLTGNFTIRTDGGSISFRVEEYKRPRFQVAMKAPDYAISGEETEVTGKATLYAGPGLNDAKVSYRVFLEEVRYWWWGRDNNNTRELVASGETTTDAQGAFTIAFTPAEGLAQKRTRYRYVIEADVADDTGETHPAETSVGLRSDKPVIGLRPSGDVLDVSDSLKISASGAEENLTIVYHIVRVQQPDAALKERRWDFPDRPLLERADYEKLFPGIAAEGSKPLAEWQQVDRRYHSGNLTLADGQGEDALDLSGFIAGHYRIEWEYPDGTVGAPVKFSVVEEGAGRLPEGMLYHALGTDQRPEIGTPLEITVISAVDLPHVPYGWASRKGTDDGIAGGGTRTTFRYTPTDADRGGIQFNAGFLRFNSSYEISQRFNLGWDNKKLLVDYATFRDKLRPGTPEKWTLTLKNADGTPVMAAALAAMYDASLDQIYRGQQWGLNLFPNFGSYRNFFQLYNDGANSGYGRTNKRMKPLPILQALPLLDLGPFTWYGPSRYVGGIRARAAGVRSEAMNDAAPQTYSSAPVPLAEASVAEEAEMKVSSVPPPPPPPGAPNDEDNKGGEEAPVQIRKNLQETAIWLPELTSNEAGELIVSFDSPEALTSWNFRVLAHDKDLNTAVSSQTVVTQKELMVLPNVPRFVREGDEIELTARVNNLTEEAMPVQVTLELFDPATNAPLSLGAAAGAGACEEEQSVGPQSGTTFCFPLQIPDGMASTGPIGYRIITRGAGFSDGEENIIPVLTDRTLITVSQPFYLKRKDKKTVTLPLLASNNSQTLQHVGYTFEATTNPAWMALKALPYLMEYPYDCTEQLANRYFANQLAFATVSRKPVLETVFRRWQNDPDALKSELELNANLKNALLTETPWLRAAQSEAQQRARIGDLFDLKQLAEEQVTALEKLANRQDAQGYFSWFPGGRENRYMTQYVVETLGRMQQLGVVTPDQTARVSGISKAAVLWLDQELAEDLRKLQKRMKNEKDWEKDYRPASSVVHYLYARSQVNSDLNTDKKVDEALTFFSERTKATWLEYGLYEQALIAITYATPQQASRPQDATTKLIVESLRERAIRRDEFGMYWKYGRGYRWQNLPIETHCRILEAFQVAGGTQDELDEMRLWLLTNKRTNRWPTTKSTAAAVYALLNAGSDWTKSDGKAIKVDWPSSNALSTRVRAAQESAEAATGAFSVSAAAGEVSSDLATVKLRNKNNNLVWGGVYWQYTELAEKVEASNDGPLTLERELFHRQPTDDGMRLVPITADEPLSAGDRVTVRLILRSDRDLDFVHLKDRRAATFEPIEQLSGYQYKNGLGYYFAPGDLATNFFIDHLPKGTYTLEYDLFATYSGSFSNGLGRVQCMYAPEFGGNTAGARIVVQ